MKNQFGWSAVMAATSLLLVSQQGSAQARGSITQNSFNPAVSVIFDAGFASYSNKKAYEIAGFPLAGEAGVAEQGFALNEVELIASADIDDKFYGELTVGMHQDGDETETEIEEAYFQTTALPHGLTLKGGKFFSELGYLNVHHKHAWDFADAPLLYRALLGRQYGDAGLQARWVAPTALFIELGAEWTRGDAFPAGGSGKDGRGAGVLFAHLGGDVGQGGSWQLGFSHLQADEVTAELGGHSHGAANTADNEFVGETRLSAVDLIYKWAPKGNSKARHLKLQAEYFRREMDGRFSYVEGANSGDGSLLAKQDGWYLQAVYQFVPRWRVGLRYDHLGSENRQVVSNRAGFADDDELFEATGWADEGVEPERSTVMLDYSNSEFSRLRLQYSTEDSRHAGEGRDNQVLLQYVYSLGAHGAHRF